MAGHLWDSSVLIHVLRRNPAARELLTQLTQEGASYCSALTVYEVQVGIRAGEERASEAVLGALTILPVTGQIARTAAEESRRFRSRGHTLSSIDAMIGATALVHDLTLVTADKSGFPMPGLRKMTL